MSRQLYGIDTLTFGILPTFGWVPAEEDEGLGTYHEDGVFPDAIHLEPGELELTSTYIPVTTQFTYAPHKPFGDAAFNDYGFALWLVLRATTPELYAFVDVRLRDDDGTDYLYYDTATLDSPGVGFTATSTSYFDVIIGSGTSLGVNIFDTTRLDAALARLPVGDLHFEVRNSVLSPSGIDLAFVALSYVAVPPSRQPLRQVGRPDASRQYPRAHVDGSRQVSRIP